MWQSASKPRNRGSGMPLLSNHLRTRSFPRIWTKLLPVKTQVTERLFGYTESKLLGNRSRFSFCLNYGMRRTRFRTSLGRDGALNITKTTRVAEAGRKVDVLLIFPITDSTAGFFASSPMTLLNENAQNRHYRIRIAVLKSRRRHFFRAHLLADVGGSASFSQEPRRRLLPRLAVRTEKLWVERTADAHQQGRRSVSAHAAGGGSAPHSETVWSG
jgi:hypothetical protein